MTDSPWFWCTLFVCAALLILTVAGPQIDRRQRRLDRQFFARQEAGQSVQQLDPAVVDQGGPSTTLVPVRPLTFGLTVVVVLITVGYWGQRWRGSRAGGRPRDRENSP